jgi:hypothetical protein
MSGKNDMWDQTYCENEVNSQDRRNHNEDTGAEHHQKSKLATPRNPQRYDDRNGNEDDAQIRHQVQHQNSYQKCRALRHAIFCQTSVKPHIPLTL